MILRQGSLGLAQQCHMITVRGLTDPVLQCCRAIPYLSAVWFKAVPRIISASVSEVSDFTKIEWLSLLSHLMANAGNVLQVVRIQGDRETVIHEQKFEIRMPQSQAILELPEENIWELQAICYQAHYRWTLNGNVLAETDTRMDVNADAAQYTMAYQEKGEEPRTGSDRLPGALLQGEQLSAFYSQDVMNEKAMRLYVYENVPDPFDYDYDLKNLKPYLVEEHYLFQEGAQGPENVRKIASPSADGNRTIVFMVQDIGMPEYYLIYRERPAKEASDHAWRMCGGEQTDQSEW